MAYFEEGNVQIAAICEPVSSVFHFPSFQFGENIQELSSCSRSIKLLRELYSLQVTYNPLWRRLRQQNTSRRTVQKLQVRRKVVVYSKVVLWDILPDSVLEIIHLTDFSNGIKWYKNWIKSAVQIKDFCVLSAVSLRGCSISQEVAAFIDSLKAVVHSCVEQPGIYTSQFTWAKIIYRLSCLYLFILQLLEFRVKCSISRVFQEYFKTVLH